MHFNVRSLRNKINDVEVFLVDKNVDIVCVSEHFLSDAEVSSTVLGGYIQ